MQNNQQPATQGIWEDVERSMELQPASHEKRFYNCLIDNFFFAILYLALQVGLVFWEPSYANFFFSESGDNNLLGVVFFSGSYFLFYFISEALTDGVSLGKKITGTRVSNRRGRPLTATDIAIRSVTRLLPFEMLSGISTPWHDSLSNTIVVHKKATA